jgi:hypothetical protein
MLRYMENMRFLACLNIVDFPDSPAPKKTKGVIDKFK